MITGDKLEAINVSWVKGNMSCGKRSRKQGIHVHVDFFLEFKELNIKKTN